MNGHVVVIAELTVVAGGLILWNYTMEFVDGRVWKYIGDIVGHARIKIHAL